MKIKFLIASMVCVGTFLSVAEAAEEMSLTPSVWAGWMRGSMTVDGQKAKVSRASDEYFSDLDIGYSGELILRNDEMVVLGFIDYFDPMSANVKVGGQKGELDSSQLIGGLAIGYPFGSGSSTFDVLVGLQTVQLDNDLEMFGGATYSEKEEVYDAVLMVRIKQELFSNFFINIPLTIGGGYLSESEFVYDAGVQLLYQFGDSLDVRAGYRIAGYDFGDSSDSTDFYQQGYTLGLGLNF